MKRTLVAIGTHGLNRSRPVATRSCISFYHTPARGCRGWRQRHTTALFPFGNVPFLTPCASSPVRRSSPKRVRTISPFGYRYISKAHYTRFAAPGIAKDFTLAVPTGMWPLRAASPVFSGSDNFALRLTWLKLRFRLTAW